MEKECKECNNKKDINLFPKNRRICKSIDHIIPVSKAKNEEDIIKLNHYTNLQPLCSKINRNIKRNNIIDSEKIKLNII